MYKNKLKKIINWWVILTILLSLLTSASSYNSWRDDYQRVMPLIKKDQDQNNNSSSKYDNDSYERTSFKIYSDRYDGQIIDAYLSQNPRLMEDLASQGQNFFSRPVKVFSGVNYLSSKEMSYPVLLVINMFMSCFVILSVVFLPLIVFLKK